MYRDETLLVGDGLYYLDPSFRVIGGEVFTTRPSNFLVDIDNTLQGYPARQHTRAALSRGEIPWWTPHLGMGMPYVGLGAGVFEPLAALLGRVVAPAKLTNAIVVAGLSIGALGMIALLGALGASLPARFLGAIAFVFSGWTVVWLGRINFLSEMWMPWAVLAGERLVGQVSPGRIGVLALATTLVCLPGHLPTAFHVMATVAVYVVARVLATPGRWQRRGATLGAAAVAMAVGAAVTLVQIVPILDFVAHSDLPPEGRGRQSAGAAAWTLITGDWSVVAREGPTILTAVAPTLFGTPRAASYWWPWANFAETTMYVGLVPLCLALFALSRLHEVPRARLWLVLAVVAAGIVYALPLLGLVNVLPGFDRINNGRLRLVWRFGLAIVAGLAFDRLLSGDPARGRARVRGLAALVAVVLVLPLVASPLLARSTAGIPLRFLGSGRPDFGGWLIGGWLPAALVLGGLTAALYVWSLGGWRTRAVRVAVPLLAFAEVLWFLGDFNPTVASRFAFPETPVIQFLRQDTSLFRVSSSAASGILPPNTKLPYGLYDIDVFSVLAVDRYARLQRAVNPPPASGQSPAFRAFHWADPGAHRGLLNLMNVKYVVVARPSSAPRADPFAGLSRFRLAYDREVRIYENLDVRPRAFLVDGEVVVDGPAAALASVAAAGFDPAATVVLEDPTSPRLGGGDGAPSPPGDAEVLALTANRVVVRVAARRPAYLVLSEVYYPGWHARIGGHPTAVYRADYLFRAVHVPAGTHEVVFEFAPRSYAVAGVASVGAAALVLACLVWGGLGRISVRRAPPRP